MDSDKEQCGLFFKESSKDLVNWKTTDEGEAEIMRSMWITFPDGSKDVVKLIKESYSLLGLSSFSQYVPIHIPTGRQHSSELDSDFEDGVEAFKQKKNSHLSRFVRKFAMLLSVWKIVKWLESFKEERNQLNLVTPGSVTGKKNQDVRERLQKQWGTFFKDYGDNLVLGPKISEGGQAKIFEGAWIWEIGIKYDVAVKVFNGSLRDLQNQFPFGMLQKISESFYSYPNSYAVFNSCLIYGATVLKDDRFAFVMRRYHSDLRKLIDKRTHHNNGQAPPFPSHEARHIMWEIAKGMAILHKYNILHRDLKASNVLIWSPTTMELHPTHQSSLRCYIADFECSVGVEGTRFWRAPEILEALKMQRPRLITKKADVYSYALTCYEILTGHIPFEDSLSSNYDVVLSGQRPKVPDYIDSRTKKLLISCWHSNPLRRPTFAKIVSILKPHNHTF